VQPFKSSACWEKIAAGDGEQRVDECKIANWRSKKTKSGNGQGFVQSRLEGSDSTYSRAAGARYRGQVLHGYVSNLTLPA